MNDLLSIWIIVAGLSGVLLALLVVRVFFGNKYVRLAEFRQLEAQLQAKETQVSLLQQAKTDADKSIYELQRRLDEKLLSLIEKSNEAARSKATSEMLSANITQLQLQSEHWKASFDKANENYQAVKQQMVLVQSESKSLQTRLTEQQDSIQSFGEQMKAQFRLLADEVLQSKTSSFNQQQETRFNDLLNPFRDRLLEFRTALEDKFTKASTERIELAAQLKTVHDLNQKLGQQAENLAKALTSQVKQQGDWGEGILETILQYIGLKKDIHYYVQQVSANEDGKTIKPDFVVRYPDDKYVVIDSKVTLTHYARFCETAKEADQQLHLALMVKSFRSHIDGLALRQYHHLNGSLDYIIAFIPVEGAFISAVQADTSLWQYAFDKRILLVSPTLLLATLKIIHELWKQEAVNKNAQQMAERAGKLYEKLAGFVSNLDDIGAKLQAASKIWNEAKGQLHTGKGNLLSQAEMLKQLGAKTNKQIQTPPQASPPEDDLMETENG